MGFDQSRIAIYLTSGIQTESGKQIFMQDIRSKELPYGRIKGNEYNSYTKSSICIMFHFVSQLCIPVFITRSRHHLHEW